ncbi:hypothetical protein Droror1_Dr00006502 [Drosera rotundifolia]
MKQLQHLDLSGSNFRGSVPHQLSNITSLRYLRLGYNDLLLDNLNWLTLLSNMQFFEKNSANLSRMDNLIHVLNRLPSLSELHLKRCGLHNRHLSGIQVNSTLLGSLQYLDLGQNYFGSLVPMVLQNFSFLRDLNLSENCFPSQKNCLGGSVPMCLGEFKSLESFSLRFNRFSHVEGGILSFIRSARRMKELDLSLNVLFEELLESHSNSSTFRSHQLEKLVLSYNELTGHIPTETIGQLSLLRVLYLDNNNLSGSSPSFTEQLLLLEEFYLSSNQISGGIPSFPSSLQTIDLSNNCINGTIPHFASSLKYIDLSYNNIDGSIPNFPSNLSYIDLSHNRINGGIPCFPSSTATIIINHNQFCGPFSHLLSQESKLSLLGTLDLSDNLITGFIPQYILHTMPNLAFLNLANNKLDGTIPDSLCELTELDDLDLQGNRFSGMIPDCWNYSFLFSIVLSSNKLSGSISSSFLQISSLEYLNLSNNTLQGEIPSFACWPDMEILDLGGNNLSGTIPLNNTHGHTDLTILRLRENHLEGQIPSALCSCPRLRIIDLADNDLAEHIPSCFGNFTFISQPDTNGGYTMGASITEVFQGLAA